MAGLKLVFHSWDTQSIKREEASWLLEQALDEGHTEAMASTQRHQRGRSTHHTGVAGILEVVMQEFGGTILECFGQGTK